jgi:hypothetical protein
MGSTNTPLEELRLPEIHLCSRLDMIYREELEQLFFFNPRQSKVQDQVRKTVAQYGPPEIQDDGRSITLGIRNIQCAQALFILYGKERAHLLGALVYVRKKERLKVLYLALKPIFTITWRDSCTLLIFVINALREVARSIRGVDTIELEVGSKASCIRVR